MIEQAARGWERNPARSLKILTYSLPLGQGQAHDEDDEEACHIVELGGWLNVAAEHDWGDCRLGGEGELFYRGKSICTDLGMLTQALLVGFRDIDNCNHSLIKHIILFPHPPYFSFSQF